MDEPIHGSIVWVPTLNLQWVRYVDLAQPTHPVYGRTLQQQWLNTYTGDLEWRDVPSVETVEKRNGP